jgi:glutathione S-transferase
MLDGASPTRTTGQTMRYVLYSENSSPFSAPVRIAIYAKELDIEICPPPGGLKSVAYHAINPLGTIPCLVRDDGFTLPESAAILEYLNERFPQRPLLPEDPDLRARARLLQRIGELGIMTSTVELMQIARSPNRDEHFTGIWLTRLVRALASLQAFLGTSSFAAGEALTLADCQLAPALFGVPPIAVAFGTGDLIAAYPSVAKYYHSCLAHPAIKRVVEEMRQAR